MDLASWGTPHMFHVAWPWRGTVCREKHSFGSLLPHLMQGSAGLPDIPILLGAGSPGILNDPVSKGSLGTWQ